MAATPDSGGSKTPSGKEDSSSKERWFKKPVVWIGALVTAVITGVLINLVTGAVSRAGQGGPAPNIEVDGMTAQYVPSRSGIPARPVKLDFEIRNTGNQLAIIRAVRVTVQQIAALPICFSAGALVSTGNYHAALPVNPSPGRSVDIPTAQQVAPDAADRFDITLGLPVKRQQEDIYVYRVRLGLLYDNSGVPSDAGEAIMTLPIAPYESYFWTKQFAAHPTSVPVVISAAQAPSASKCLVNNSRKLHDILAMAGARPAQLTAVQSQLSTCCGWTMPDVKAQQVCGPALERPATMALSCDSTGILEKMNWSAWTFSYAQGTGIYRAQSCTPDCASGKVHYYNVTVRFDMPTNTDKNGWLWDRMTLRFPNASPYGRSTMVLTNLVGRQ
jgi:hypothetical protein